MANLPFAAQDYKDALLEDVLPFWLKHGLDSPEEGGGYLNSLEADGSVFDTDKPVWFCGRMSWVLASCALTFRDDPRAAEWVKAARIGVDFAERHCFDAEDGQMYFLVTRDGRPLRKRRYVYSESFAAIGFAATARAELEVLGLDDGNVLFRRALDVYQSFRRRLCDGSLPAKINPDTRPLRGIGIHLITLNTIQCLRQCVPEELSAEAGLDWDAEADKCISEIQIHVKDEQRTVYETLSADGSVLSDCVEGRTLNPGHAIEAAWFVMDEGRRRGDRDKGRALIDMGAKMLDFMWSWGWDEEHGGILYFRDALYKPVQDYWHDMKFWWPQNEAEIATLMAWKLTHKEKYLAMWRQVHDYSWGLFPDPEHGEWFGYFTKDGRRTSSAKGNHFKGCFHIPRMMMVCHELLAE